MGDHQEKASTRNSAQDLLGFNLVDWQNVSNFKSLEPEILAIPCWDWSTKLDVSFPHWTGKLRAHHRHRQIGIIS